MNSDREHIPGWRSTKERGWEGMAYYSKKFNDPEAKYFWSLHYGHKCLLSSAKASDIQLLEINQR